MVWLVGVGVDSAWKAALADKWPRLDLADGLLHTATAGFDSFGLVELERSALFGAADAVFAD